MTVHMDQLSWVDYERRVREGAVVFLPCGATEQHGPHLPLGTDALLASAISADVAARVGGLVAPALSYGYKSQPKCGGGQHFCGTTSLDGATLSALVRDAVREFHRHGVRRLVLVLGHYENQWFVAEGIQLALRDLGPDAGLEVMRLEHWDFCHEQTLTDIFPEGFPGFALEHAAVIETSLMLHFHPQLVALEKIPDDAPADFPPYDMYPTRTEWVPPSGVLSSARGSSAAKGQRLAHDIGVQGVCAVSLTTNPLFLEHTALLVIDMQRDFCALGGYADQAGMDVSRLRAPIPAIQALLDRARGVGMLVVHTREGHRPDLSDLPEPKRRRAQATGAAIGSPGPLGRLLVRGEFGHDLIDELQPRAGEPVIDKPGYSAFAHTDLELILRRRGIERLILTGVTTEVCVASTLRQAIDLGFDCLTVRDACASADPQLHAAALAMIEVEGGLFGSVIDSHRLLSQLEGSP